MQCVASLSACASPMLLRSKRGGRVYTKRARGHARVRQILSCPLISSLRPLPFLDLFNPRAALSPLPPTSSDVCHYGRQNTVACPSTSAPLLRSRSAAGLLAPASSRVLSITHALSFAYAGPRARELSGLACLRGTARATAAHSTTACHQVLCRCCGHARARPVSFLAPHLALACVDHGVFG